MPPPVQEHNQGQIIAGDAAVLARRYAGAFYALAAEQKQLDAAAGDLRALRHFMQENTEFRAVTRQPRLARAQLVKAMQGIAAAAGFDKLTANFLALIARNRRLAVLDAIIDAFLAELAARRGEFTAEVRAARALSPAQEEQLTAKLHELAGGKVHISVREDKTLIGGITVKLGSRLIDASVKSKLDRLERQLKSPLLASHKGAA